MSLRCFAPLLAATLLLAISLLSSSSTTTLASNVYRIPVRSASDQAALERLAARFPLLDFWTEPAAGLHLGFVDVLLPDEMRPEVARMGLALDTVFVDRVEQRIAEERLRIANNKDAEFFEEYQTVDAINAFLQDLARNNPSIAETFSIGTTVEGREIVTVRISSNLNDSNRPVVFFHGGTHAREWISPATVTYMANELVEKYGSDENVTALVNQFEFVVTGVLNQDGYVYTFEEDRMWRKNREDNEGSACVGVDINRNWPYRWNNGGSSDLPCSDSYHGPYAGSTAESTAASGYIDSVGHRLAIYIDFHAYSQLIMSPWGWSCDLPDDYTYMKAAGDEMAAAILEPYDTRYDVGSICNIIYQASGSSADYAYGTHGVVLAYGIELRDQGRYGFLLPPDQIIPSGIETFEGLKAMAFYYLNNKK